MPKTSLRDWLFRAWYWYVNRTDRNAEILFMNYGYSSPGQSIVLPPGEEPNRHSIQLYHLLASSTDLRGKTVVEVGCGRGGGLAYVTRAFSPAQALGIDLDKGAVAFSNGFHRLANLSFRQGDAQSLPLEAASFDVVLNVESSHRYPDAGAFLREVGRVLKPGGYFLFTDFRYDHEMPGLRRLLDESGLEQVKEERITPCVVAALEQDDLRKRKLIRKLAPRILHDIAFDFAGTTGSKTYNHFKEGRYVYFFYVFRKPA